MTILLGSLSLTGCRACTAGNTPNEEKAVVSVAGHLLTVKAFGHRLEARLRGVDPLYAKHPENLKRVKEDIVREFVQETLVSLWAAAHGIAVEKETFDSEIKRIRGGYPDDLTFREALIKENLSFDDWSAGITRSLLEKKVFDELSKQVTDPSEDEIKQYFESHKDKFKKNPQIRLRQIVVEKEDEARRIQEELKRGAPFERMARQFSMGPESSSGGNTGWIEKGVLDVFDAAFQLSVGATSGIVRSPYGFHIYQVLEKKPAMSLNYPAAKASILKTLRAEKEQASIVDWFEKELKAIKVLRDDSLIKAVEVYTEGS